MTLQEQAAMLLQKIREADEKLKALLLQAPTDPTAQRLLAILTR